MHINTSGLLAMFTSISHPPFPVKKEIKFISFSYLTVTSNEKCTKILVKLILQLFLLIHFYLHLQAKDCYGASTAKDRTLRLIGYKQVNNWYITYLRDTCIVALLSGRIYIRLLCYIISCSERAIFSIHRSTTTTTIFIQNTI